jgi:hypothetical protein
MEMSLREDIKLIGKETWEFFKNKYSGGPEIIRKTVEDKGSYSSTLVEVFHRPVKYIFYYKLFRLI